MDLHILHVEDDKVDALLLKRALEQTVFCGADGHKCDIHIRHVHSLGSALTAAGEEKFDAVLLDLSLTDVCGLDNVRALRAQQPQTPIIILSGNADMRLAEEALRIGACDYVTKTDMGEPVLALAITRACTKKLRALPTPLRQKSGSKPLVFTHTQKHCALL